MFGLNYIKNVVTLQYDSALCNGCTMCIQVCPHEVFGMKDKKAVILNRNHCMECGACMKNCAQNAIQVKAGVGCAAGILNGKLNGSSECCCGPKNSSCC